MEALTLRSQVVDRIVAHARAAAPDECCGMLIGGAHGVESSASARNIADPPRTRFLIDPKDHLDALRAARRRGLDVIGFYHSHPHSAAVPSATDIAEADYPDSLHLIVGLGSEPPDVRVYRLASGAFQAVPVVVVP